MQSAKNISWFTRMLWLVLGAGLLPASKAVLAGGTPTSTPVASAVMVKIVDFEFTPAIIRIKPGTKIRWLNREKRQYHSVWFKDMGQPEPDYIFPGESYDYEFKQSGTFAYFCGPHPRMTGVVIVE